MNARALATWPVAGGALIAGFAVAQATGVRPLGGAVLLAGGAWCARRWLKDADAARAVGLVAVMAGAFVASHVLAKAIGAWPAALVAASVTAAAAWAVVDAGARRRLARSAVS